MECHLTSFTSKRSKVVRALFRESLESGRAIATNTDHSSATMGGQKSRMEKALEKELLKKQRELEKSNAMVDELAVDKGRRPLPRKRKGRGRGSDHGADLHYGENNNGFPSARVNSQGPEDDHHLHGVHNRFDDDVPSIDAETIAGRGARPSFGPLFPPRGDESGDESGYDGDGRDRDNDLIRNSLRRSGPVDRAVTHGLAVTSATPVDGPNRKGRYGTGNADGSYKSRWHQMTS